MKILKRIVASILFSVPVLLHGQNVKFADSKLEAGNILRLTYDPAGTRLAGKADVKCSAAFFYPQSMNYQSINLVKQEGSIYSAEVSTADSTYLVALTFYSDDIMDTNPAGYFIKLYKDGQLTADAYLQEAKFLDYYASYYGIKGEPLKTARAYKQAFELEQDLKKKFNYFYRYLINAYAGEPIGGRKMIMNRLSDLSGATDERAVMEAGDLYKTLKMQGKSDSVHKLLLSKYPKGTYAYNVSAEEIYLEKDPIAMEIKLQNLKKNFGLDAKRASSFYGRLAYSFGKTGNYEKFDLYADQVSDKMERAELYNSVAWPLAEKNQNSMYAARVSKSSLELIESAREDKRPNQYDNQAAYLKQLDRNYAVYADTYALIMHNMGNDKEAVLYQEKAGQFSDANGNERYVMYLDLSGNKEKAFLEAERFLKEGKGTDAMRDRLKSIYDVRGSNVPFETYVVNLEKSAKEKQHAEWVKMMINVPAPAFSLQNMKGETVSLASLKGKIVVLDYWATWCGPCVASFPGMQKAVTKYANDPNVAFLFINTRQTEGNREELVKKFIAEKKYTFNVLYDTKNKQDPNQFDVLNAYGVSGIPTKFIIDGNGKIRFKVVGFSGSADGIVQEIDAMIGLAASAASSGK